MSVIIKMKQWLNDSWLRYKKYPDFILIQKDGPFENFLLEKLVKGHGPHIKKEGELYYHYHGKTIRIIRSPDIKLPNEICLCYVVEKIKE